MILLVLGQTSRATCSDLSSARLETLEDVAAKCKQMLLVARVLRSRHFLTSLLWIACARQCLKFSQREDANQPNRRDMRDSDSHRIPVRQCQVPVRKSWIRDEQWCLLPCTVYSAFRFSCRVVTNVPFRSTKPQGAHRSYFGQQNEQRDPGGPERPVFQTSSSTNLVRRTLTHASKSSPP